MRKQTSGSACRAALVIAASIGALVAAPDAAAHARLLATDPADDVVVEAAPRRVRLRFSEPVETAFGAVRVYDERARRVDRGSLSRPRETEVAIGVERDLPDGTYTVTWRVVSADAHPVSGAFVFHVGAPGANPAGIAGEVGGGGAGMFVKALFAVVRAVDFALVLFVAGGIGLLLFALRDASSALRSRLAGLLALAAVALAAVGVAGIVLQGATAAGSGLREALDPDVLADVLETRFGRVWAGQAALALLVAGLLLLTARRNPRFVVAAFCCACHLVVTPAASGHASVAGGLSFAADVVHVAGAAAWAGGLAALLLALVLAGGERWTLAGRAVPRFSLVAIGAVTVLVLAGTVNGAVQLGSLPALWETTYGRLLALKVALVVPVLALGALHNRRVVPGLRGGTATASERDRFLRTAGAEVALIAAVVGVTALLVAQPPARAEAKEEGPVAEAPLGPYRLRLSVDPAVRGGNSIELAVTDRSGRPVQLAEAGVSATLARETIGPLRFDAHPLGPGRFAVHAAQLPLAGDWRFRVEVRRGEFDAYAATVSIPIREE